MSPQRLEKIKQILNRRQHDLTVVMENVHKPQNMAAIARTCDAVGIPEVHVVTPFNKTSFLNAKSAGGCKKWVATVLHKSIDNAFQTLRAKGFQIVVASFSQDAVPFRQLDYTVPTAVVVGSELEGLSEYAVGNADHNIMIPMMGMVQSLNVSVATALILYEAQRQREEKGLYDNIRPTTSQSDTYPLEWGYPNLAKRFRSNNLPLPEMDEEGNILAEDR